MNGPSFFIVVTMARRPRDAARVSTEISGIRTGLRAKRSSAMDRSSALSTSDVFGTRRDTEPVGCRSAMKRKNSGACAGSAVAFATRTIRQTAASGARAGAMHQRLLISWLSNCTQR